jgi:hypothetical protein
MLYLVWYDADARRTVGEKIQDASAAYARRFSVAPNLVLVNIAEVTELAEIEVRAERTVQPHHFWVGRSDQRAAQLGAPADG